MEKVSQDLEDNWAVVTEALQTILRRENYPEPYETLKKLSRKSSKIGKKEIYEFISELDVSDSTKEEMMKITPQSYARCAKYSTK